MKRYYVFTWHPTKDAKYSNPISRNTVITLSNPTGETAIDAKTATELFVKRCGNLKKNTIVKIKEIGDKGQIGEDIIPIEGSSIVPAAKKN